MNEYVIYDADTGEVLDTLVGFPLSYVEELVDEYLLDGIAADYRSR